MFLQFHFKSKKVPVKIIGYFYFHRAIDLNKINIMRIIVFFVFIVLVAISCRIKKVSVPPNPAGMNAVIRSISGKKFSTQKLALISTLISDKNNPYEWFDETGDTTSIFRNLEKEKMKLAIHFVNDSLVELTDETGTSKGKWMADDQPKSDEDPGIFLRITIIKEEKLFGDHMIPVRTTFSYKVLGINDKQLLLQTQNMYNVRRVAALMKAG